MGYSRFGYPLEVQVSVVACLYLFEAFTELVFQIAIRKLIDFGLNLAFTGGPCFRRGVVDQVFHECCQCIGCTIALDKSGYGEFHEVFAGASQAVAGSAETGKGERVSGGQLEAKLVQRLNVNGWVIFLAIMAWNFFGDGIRDAVDPKSKH